MRHHPDTDPGSTTRPRVRHGRALLFVVLTLVGSWSAPPAQAQSDPLTLRLQTRLPRFTVRQSPLGHAMTALHSQGVPVCYEQDNDRDAATGLVLKPMVNIDATDLPIGGLLDRIVLQAGAYRWTTDTQHGLVNVLPVDAYVERVRLNVNTRGTGLLDALWSKELDLAAYGIYPLHDGPWLPNPPVTLNMQNATLKDVLNALVAQAPGWAWQLVGVEGRRSLTFTYWGSE